MKPPHSDWIVPDWPAPANVRAFITTRSGGFSSGPYAMLNLGLRTGDDARTVSANRERLTASLPEAPRWLRQVHGAAVADLDAPSAADVPVADAAIATRPDTVCAVLVADCIPVLLVQRDGNAVAIAHAGWRGLAAGVIENVVQRMPRPASGLIAYLGPGIGPSAFEVGPDVYHAFVSRNAQSAAAFTARAGRKWLANLFLLARQRLEGAGVTEIHGGGLCTHSDPERFFSYRRDGTTGRMAAVIWRSE